MCEFALKFMSVYVEDIMRKITQSFEGVQCVCESPIANWARVGTTTPPFSSWDPDMVMMNLHSFYIAMHPWIHHHETALNQIVHTNVGLVRSTYWWFGPNICVRASIEPTFCLIDVKYANSCNCATIDTSKPMTFKVYFKVYYVIIEYWLLPIWAGISDSFPTYSILVVIFWTIRTCL